jgi:L-ascorbate metabolism protein UlaG (beta-lactamase superfamily)
MPEQPDRSEAIRELFSRSLKARELAFLYLGYAGLVVRIEDRIVAIDIANLLGNEEIETFSQLDLLAFTHSHGDHYNRARARKMLEITDAHVIAQTQVADDLKNIVSSERLTTAGPGTTIKVGGFEVVAVEGVHPRPISIYRISKDRVSIFHAGDSGYSHVKDYPAEIAFLPTGRPSPSCSPESALKFALDLNPSVVVPMHGSPVQLNQFKKLVKNELPSLNVIIPREFTLETVLI